MIKISIVIPVYNMADYITVCLDSLAVQTLKEYEAICVDDGSTDDSAKLVEEYSKRDSRVRLIRFGENRGVFAARNKALECAEGEFVAFLDPDDWYPEPDILETMYVTAKKNDVDICGGGWTNHYPDKEPQTKFGGTLWGLGCFERPGVIDYKDYQFDFGYQRFIFKTALLRKHNITFPPYTRFQDPPFFVRAMAAAGRFYGMNRSTYNYRASYKTVDFSKNDYKKARDLIKGVRDNIDFSKSMGLELLHTLMYDRCNNMTNCFADAIRNNEEAFIGVCGLELALDKEIIERNKSRVTSGMRPYTRSLQELFQEKTWMDSGLSDFKTIRTVLDYYAEYVEGGASEEMRNRVIGHFWLAAKRPAGTPRVSILIPAYNVEDSVGASIESALAQTMSDIEVICVDDGSTDQTWDVICNYAKKDDRVIPVRHNRNLGLYMARKTAVFLAVGEYMTCLDSDDLMTVNACADAYACALETGADIVQGQIEIKNVNNFPESRLEWIRKLTRPYPSVMDGKNVLGAMFVDRNMGTNLLAKMYSRKLIQKAFSSLSDIKITMAEDVMASFAIATFARKYCPIDKPVYLYTYGTGITGKSELTLEQYRAQCCGVDVVPEIKRFIGAEGAGHPLRERAYWHLRKRLLDDAYGRVESFLSTREQQCEGLRYFAARIGVLEFVKYLAERFFGNRAALILRLDYLGFIPKIKAKKIRTVGILYHHLTPGGIQRVIALHIPMFQRMGYKIVLFLEKTFDETCYRVPDGVEFVYLPESPRASAASIAQRLEALAREISSHGVDVMYYHPYNSHIMQWDLMVCKLVCKIPLIMHYHNCVGLTLYTYQTVPVFSCLAARARMCDKVIALSRIDAMYFQSQGVDAQYMPNPVSEQLFALPRSSNWDCKTILWCARISWEKHPLDPIMIFDRVHRRMPDTRLVIVGGGKTEIIGTMKKRIEELGLSDCIELAGEQKNPYPYYQKATAFLMTSVFEGFPMTLLESGALGIPTVMYSLPFLEAVRGNEGIVQVAQGDIGEAANALCGILSDKSTYRHMSEVNFQHTNYFAQYDQESAWRKVFLGLTDKSDGDLDSAAKGEYDCEDVRILLEELQYCYQNGFNAMMGKIKRLEGDLKKQTDCNNDQVKKNSATQKELLGAKVQMGKLRQEVRALQSSEAYRTGMFITWPARKAWGGVKCWRDNGFKYTVKHFFGKIARRLGFKDVKW
ncbi:MAG: glycosyltransferase [Kiritimatiellae bacterium]|nr:glycosyltransferase [Kiritimatiellia bacterium]